MAGSKKTVSGSPQHPPPAISGHRRIITWFILRSKDGAERLQVPLNVILLVLFLFSALPAGYRLIQYEMELRGNWKSTVNVQDGLPDVYFIILDAYARNDVLKEKFGFDNANFTGHLKDLGFTVIPCSQSNYQITMISILSTLSMDYLSDIPTDRTTQSWNSDITIERDKIIHNPVRTRLEELGYSTVSFESAYPWSETPDVDHYYKVDLNQKYTVLNKFETILLNSSMGVIFSEFSRRFAPSGTSEPIDPNTFDESAEFYYLVHRNTLDKLDFDQPITRPQICVCPFGRTTRAIRIGKRWIVCPGFKTIWRSLHQPVDLCESKELPGSLRRSYGSQKSPRSLFSSQTMVLIRRIRIPG